MFEEMIEGYLTRLRGCKEYDVKSVILFGSVARGQAKEHSDIDIIVVASGLPELKRRDILPPFPKPARIQDIWMTPEELEDMVIAKTLFVVDALLEGRVLQDDGTAAGAWDRLIASLKRLKAKRLKSGWMIPRDDLRTVIHFD
ncbi:MAG: nucleotidyltransferase domain-containing protein [Methanothrix sp.]